jgi:cytochrome c-type biogenesis protein CcmH/NrfG
VFVELASRLERTDKRPADAIAILEAGTEMFPANAVLFLRLGGTRLNAGDRAGAAEAYRSAVHLNPLLRYGVVQLTKLGG